MGMAEELADCLTRNSARLISWEKFCLGATMDAKKQDKTSGKTISDANVLKIERHYEFEFETYMLEDVAKLLLYVKSQSMAAYHNLKVLALYRDFGDAMRRGRRDNERVIALLSRLDEVHRGKMRNAIDQCRKMGGTFACGNYFLENNETGSEICLIITGESDPTN